MKKLIKNTAIAFAFATVLGGTWMASSVHTSSANAGVQIQQAGYTTDALMTCLLYTSPSPRDKRQSRMPSSA